MTVLRVCSWLYRMGLLHEYRHGAGLADSWLQACVLRYLSHADNRPVQYHLKVLKTSGLNQYGCQAYLRGTGDSSECNHLENLLPCW